MKDKKIIGLGLFSIIMIGVYFYFKGKSKVDSKIETRDALNKTEGITDSLLKSDSVSEKMIEEKSTEEKDSIVLANTIKKLDEIAPKLKRSAVSSKEYRAILAPLGIKISIGMNKSGITIFPKHENVVKIIANKINQKGYSLLANYEIEKKTK